MSNSLSCATLEKEIAILSTLLHLRQDLGCTTESQDTKNVFLDIVTHVATLLTIFPSQSSNLNAVIGNIDNSSVTCLVFSNDRRIDLQSSSGQPYRVVPIDIEDRAEKGVSVLRDWDKLGSDWGVDKHIRDVFDIISFLQSEEHPDPALLSKALFFAHSRAFRELGARVLNFSQHWSTLPFQLLKANINEIAQYSGLAKTFHLPVNQSQRGFLQEHGLFQVHISKPAYQRAQGGAQFTLDSSNLAAWIDILDYLWHKLKSLLLVYEHPDTDGHGNEETLEPQRVRSDPPDIPTTLSICFHISTLHALKSVLRHILFLPVNLSVVYALEDAEVETDDIFAPKFGVRNNDFKPVIEDDGNPAERVMRLLDRILAWHVAVLSLWRRTNSHKSFHVHQCHYDSSGWNISSGDIRAVLREIDGSFCWSRDDVAWVLNTTLAASVHAEAALMSWACSRDSTGIFNVQQPLPVGTSQKCCRMCGLLKELIEDSDSVSQSFVLLGTHNTFYSWIPPPGLPKLILLRLRSFLLYMARKKLKLGYSSEFSDDSMY